MMHKKNNVFFRFDDVYEKDEILYNLLDFFANHNISINLEVIPARLTKELAEKISKLTKNLI